MSPIKLPFMLVAALTISTAAAADTLKVGTAFPATRFQLRNQDRSTGLASLSDVQQQKAIVFIFASW